MEEGLTGRGLQGVSSSTPDTFHWQRSDHSFAFNFLTEASPSQTSAIAAPAESQAQAQSGQDPVNSDTSSGFTFNFQIPAESARGGDLETGAIQIGKTEAGITATSQRVDASKTKGKKKKNKGGGGVELGPQKMSIEEAPKQESRDMTPEQQLNRELDWCIEQLELGLRTQKSSTKQREEASRALKTLRSSKAPVVKKRQVMRAMYGDYRKKMEEEKNKQFRLIQSAMSSMRVTAVSEPSRKPVFNRRAETTKNTTTITEEQDTHGHSHTAEQTEGDRGRFVFRASQEEFLFNFKL
ncbi:UPF0488 protein C8orf33 homolog [Hoplias malabaricus]|uniref:UPF0488 protein C8orf33 homolog n=1 Tax=Hoplias malabaricus TaxID=27720 RepID=UPI00346291B5